MNLEFESENEKKFFWMCVYSILQYHVDFFCSEYDDQETLLEKATLVINQFEFNLQEIYYGMLLCKYYFLFFIFYFYFFLLLFYYLFLFCFCMLKI